MQPDLIVEITVPPEEAELAADDLWQAGATAVALHEDDDAGVATRVVASFPTADAARLVAEELATRRARVVEVDPAWRDAWREFAQPVEVGDRITVAPAWRDVPVGPERMLLRIDPGHCFGSGSHPSTRLILAALDGDPPKPGDAVLDAGCGSGILAIAAAALGARRVTAVDIDPAAIKVTAANAAANGVGDRVTASVTPVSELAGPYDLALVNVTAGVHAELGPDVTRLVRPGGRILLAGLLPGQWRHIASAYDGTEVTSRTELDGWEGAELLRRS